VGSRRVCSEAREKFLKKTQVTTGPNPSAADGAHNRHTCCNMAGESRQIAPPGSGPPHPTPPRPTPGEGARTTPDTNHAKIPHPQQQWVPANTQIASGPSRKQDGWGRKTLCQFCPRTGPRRQQRGDSNSTRPLPTPVARQHDFRHRTEKSGRHSVTATGRILEKRDHQQPCARPGTHRDHADYPGGPQRLLLCTSPRHGRKTPPRQARQADGGTPTNVHLDTTPTHRQHRATQTPSNARFSRQRGQHQMPTPGHTSPPWRPLGHLKQDCEENSEENTASQVSAHRSRRLATRNRNSANIDPCHQAVRQRTHRGLSRRHMRQRPAAGLGPHQRGAAQTDRPQRRQRNTYSSTKNFGAMDVKSAARRRQQ